MLQCPKTYKEIEEIRQGIETGNGSVFLDFYTKDTVDFTRLRYDIILNVRPGIHAISTSVSFIYDTITIWDGSKYQDQEELFTFLDYEKEI